MAKILLIGNGCEVLSEQKGSVINTFDKVIRLGTYQLEGYENYVGSKTDICVTAHWKVNLNRIKTIPMTYITFPVFYETFLQKDIDQLKTEFISNLESDLIDKVEFMKYGDMESIISMLKKGLCGKSSLDFSKINPSLGFRSIWYLINTFPHDELYTYGFDFFKSGWYWKTSHNRDLKNRHPYIYERSVYENLISDGILKKL